MNYIPDNPNEPKHEPEDDKGFIFFLVGCGVIVLAVAIVGSYFIAKAVIH